MTLSSGGFTGRVGSEARNRGVGSKWRRKTLALRRYSSLQKLDWKRHEKGVEAGWEGAVVLEKTLVFRLSSLLWRRKGWGHKQRVHDRGHWGREAPGEQSGVGKMS